MQESVLLFDALINAMKLGMLTENAFRTRMLGLLSETEFQQYYLGMPDNNSEILKGGFMIPVDKSNSATENFVYITAVDHHENARLYKAIYKKIKKLKPAALFLIIAEFAENFLEWKEMAISGQNWKIPKLKVFSFEQIGEDHDFRECSGLDEILRHFTPDNRFTPNPVQLGNGAMLLNFKGSFLALDPLSQKEIYFSRFLMDVLIGMRHVRGIPSDLDVITFSHSRGITFLEVKEKDPAKKTVGFGLDLHRIRDLKKISDVTVTPYYLVVKRINNQTERKLVGWYYIEISDFLKFTDGGKVIEGGHGMRSATSSNPTLICELKHFKEF